MLGCCCCWIYPVLIYVIYLVLDAVYRRPRVGQLSSRYILITGCDTGFGQQLAKRLDAIGCHVFAGCLTESGETELRKSCSSRLQTISLDVSNQQSVRKAFQIVSDKLPPGQGLWGVMNNAGILGRCGPHEFYNMEDYHQVLGVNLLGLIDVTMTFLPLVKKSRGRIVNTASVFGRHVIAGCPPYCISKYGVEAFTDGLRRAMRGFNVKAILIEPGLHLTPIMSKANIDRQQQEAWDRASPDAKQEYGEHFIRTSIAEGHENTRRIASSRISDVVDAYEHALLGRFPRARYLVGKDAKFFWMPIQWLPEWLGDWVLDHLNTNKPIPAALQTRQ